MKIVIVGAICFAIAWWISGQDARLELERLAENHREELRRLQQAHEEEIENHDPGCQCYPKPKVEERKEGCACYIPAVTAEEIHNEAQGF